ncbi:MAG TPA: hypothetical protein VFL85_03510, partial [Candidatus Saccharimonadales bacterium]|nr:hypothetical protein [Candidatus Saccharimonadales bacterium]
DQLLTLAFDIYTNEKPSWKTGGTESNFGMRWEPANPTLFREPLCLYGVRLRTPVENPHNLTVVHFDFDGCEFPVRPSANPAEYEDVFMRDVLQRMRATFDEHDHAACPS